MGEDELKNLIIEAQNGDKEAFGKIYQNFLTPIYRFIYFRVSNKTDAEDMVQEVFIKVFNSLSNIRTGEGSILAYFYTIARNLVIDSYRKRKTFSVDIDTLADELSDGNDSMDEVAKKEDILKLKQALDKISEQEREVLILKFINNYSYEEIAKILGKSEESIRQLKSRGLKSLNKFIKREDLNL